MALRVWVNTVTESGPYAHEETNRWVAWARQQLESSRCGSYKAASDPDTADIILFIESYKHKFPDYIPYLLGNELIRKYPNRSFSFDYEDGPIGFLPGVYSSMRRQQADSIRYWAGGYIGINPLSEEQSRVEPQLLFSFRGFASSEARKRLLQNPPQRSDCRITQTFRWLNHSETEQRTYFDEIRDSKFVLCPRGVGPASGRLFETMAAGRVPVIVADDWALPVGPPWFDFALFLAEDRICDAAEVIEKHADQWPERGQLSRHVYNEWYEKGANLRRTLQYIEQILHRRPAAYDERENQEKWPTLRFAWEQGWTVPQKVGRAIRTGQFRQKCRDALRRRLGSSRRPGWWGRAKTP